MYRGEYIQSGRDPRCDLDGDAATLVGERATTSLPVAQAASGRGCPARSLQAPTAHSFFGPRETARAGPVVSRPLVSQVCWLTARGVRVARGVVLEALGVRLFARGVALVVAAERGVRLLARGVRLFARGVCPAARGVPLMLRAVRLAARCVRLVDRGVRLLRRLAGKLPCVGDAGVRGADVALGPSCETGLAECLVCVLLIRSIWVFA